MPASALDGVDGVIHLAGLSNDPTAEYDPEANWQMNAIATETLARTASTATSSASCSRPPARSTTACRPGMHDETRRSCRAAPTRRRSATARRRCSRSWATGLCPVILRNGTVYGHSPRMRFDLVVNTFVKDALLKGALSLHGGGWMWRPLVDVQDVSDAMIAASRRRPSSCAARSSTCSTRTTRSASWRCWWRARSSSSAARSARRGARAAAHARLRVLEHEAREPARLPARALGGRGDRRHPGSIDARGQDDAVTDPRFYNIRWLELLSELTPQIDLPGCPVTSASDHGRRRAARPRPRGAAARRRIGLAPSPRGPGHHRRAAVERAVRRGRARRRLQLRGLPQRRGLRARGGRARSRSTRGR